MSMNGQNGADKPTINFPDENNSGHVWKKGNIIFYQTKNNSYTGEINCDKLRYVYLVINVHRAASLFLFDHHQHYIPIHFNGFKYVYEALSRKFGFNDQVFSDHLHSKEIVKKEIWRRIRTRNYDIVESSQFRDYAEGFEIQSPDKEFVSWDTTYTKLAESRHIFLEESPYGQKLLTFSYPVRVGNIVLDNLRAYLDNQRRDDAPMLHFYADCYDETNSQKSYFELKRALEADVDEKANFYGYERDDQHYYRFEAEGMEFSLAYIFDNTWQFDGGCTSLSIKNNREYADLLFDLDYESKIEISENITLAEQTYITGNYKKDVQIKRRPEQLNLQLGDKPVIWLDNKNGKIGFADKTRSRVQSMDEVESFAIQNILPAKGAGGAHLLMKLSGGRSFEVMQGKCHSFDFLREKIVQITNRSVEMEPEYHDC